jgi:hypothetical protein
MFIVEILEKRQEDVRENKNQLLLVLWQSTALQSFVDVYIHTTLQIGIRL